MIHKYRPMERMIPHKSDFYRGEKPVMLKTKRMDMSNEWMVWSYYPKAKRFKMTRLGARPTSPTRKYTNRADRFG